jgi:hypothetical protein
MNCRPGSLLRPEHIEHGGLTGHGAEDAKQFLVDINESLRLAIVRDVDTSGRREAQGCVVAAATLPGAATGASDSDSSGKRGLRQGCLGVRAPSQTEGDCE